MKLYDYLSIASERKASDLFIIAGLPPTLKICGHMESLEDKKLMPHETEQLVQDMYKMAGRKSYDQFCQLGDDDFPFSIPGLGRFRVSTYKQRGSAAAVIRIIAFGLPDPTELAIPQSVMDVTRYNKGLVLVTGSAGSGKSTTLACMIDRINETRQAHIITLEDPLEFLHKHKKSIVSQREVSSDTESYKRALRSALRQSPDVILLGEMRDYETIKIAMTAAETGHLVFSTLHTIGAVNSIDRIIDVFPASQQRQITVQLASVLRAVVTQQLIVSEDGKQIPAFEMMEMNPAIRNMIREGKIHQIDGMIYSSMADNMFSMDTYLYRLYEAGKISESAAVKHAVNPGMMKKKFQ